MRELSSASADDSVHRVPSSWSKECSLHVYVWLAFPFARRSLNVGETEDRHFVFAFQARVSTYVQI